MSEPKVEPLDADVAAFVDAERDHLDDMPEGVRARVVAGVRARLGAGGGSSGESGASSGGGDGGASGGGAVGAASRTSRAYRALSLLLTLCVGMALGALVRGRGGAAVAPAPIERIVYVDRPAAPREVTGAAPANPPGPSSVPSNPSIASSPPPPVATADESAERVLLDLARQGLLRGDPQASWEAVREHERRFPRGALAEERDALAVRALVALGRAADARSRAEALRRGHPHSVFLPAVESALSTPAVDAGEEPRHGP